MNYFQEDIKTLFTDSDIVWLNKNILDHIKYNREHSYAHILFQQDTNDNKIDYNTGFFMLYQHHLLWNYF